MVFLHIAPVKKALQCAATYTIDLDTFNDMFSPATRKALLVAIHSCNARRSPFLKDFQPCVLRRALKVGHHLMVADVRRLGVNYIQWPKRKNKLPFVI